MRLTEATVELRPRTPMEAIDLGVLLAGRHRTLLMTSWAIVTLPVFVLLSVVFQNHPYLAVFVLWWLKPAFERLPLLILSQALFGATPTLGQALKAWPATLRSQLIPSLLWRRLSLSRSFVLPVQQLENLSGAQRALRVEALSRKDLRAARLLTLVGCHLETALWIGLTVLLFALIPQQIETDWLWRALLSRQNDTSWLDYLSNALYALILIIWEPVYVACGFSLYLNRRTVLEAWDVELVFRRLRQRLTGSAYILLLGATLVLALPQAPAWAAAALTCPLPEPALSPADESAAAPDTPRLTRQALSSQAAQQSIKEVLQQPPFKNPESVSGWRFPNHSGEAGQAADGGKRGAFIDWLNGLLDFGKVVARVLEVVLWAIVLTLAGLLIWRYRSWVATFVSQRSPPVRAVGDTPDQLFGLQIGAQTLPDDIAGSAERLWDTQPREALGLLYRALLTRMLSAYHLPLKTADTEGEVLQRIAGLNDPQLDEFSRNLTFHWKNLAYGHRAPPASSRAELCDGWRRLFDHETAS